MYVLFSWTDSGLYTYHLFIWSNLNFLHNSKWIAFLYHTCLALYSFMLICCIHLLCDLLFRLYHHIAYICYHVALSCFHVVGFNGVVLPCSSLLEWDFVCRLKCPHSCFCPLFLSIYFCSAVDCVVCIVFDGCNQFSSALVYVVFESLYRCINAILNAGEFSSSFFSWHIALFIVMSFLVLCSTGWSSSLVHFKNGPKYLTRGAAQVFIPLIRILLHSLVSSSFLVLLRYSFLIFLHLHLFDSVRFQYSHVSLSLNVQIFLDLVVLFLLSCIVSRLSILT